MGFFTKTKVDYDYKFEQADDANPQNETGLANEKNESVLNVFRNRVADLPNKKANPQGKNNLTHSANANATSEGRTGRLSSKSILIIALVILAIIILVYFCSSIIPECAL